MQEQPPLKVRYIYGVLARRATIRQAAAEKAWLVGCFCAMDEFWGDLGCMGEPSASQGGGEAEEGSADRRSEARGTETGGR